MSLAILQRRGSRSQFAQSVDFLLQRRFASSIALQHADEVVTAAWRAGYSPRECVDWLAEVDGLS